MEDLFSQPNLPELVAEMPELVAEIDDAARADAAWKEAVTFFFREFVTFFFPHIAAEIDWSRGHTFLDAELAQVARGYATGKHVVDKLAQVYLKNGGRQWLLLHVEIEGRPRGVFNERMYVYNYRLFDRYCVPVVSLGLAINAGARLPLGVYRREKWGCRVTFEFPVVRLTDYAARWAELEQSENPIAVVIMAQLKALESGKDHSRKFAFKRQLVRMLYGRGYTREQVYEIFRVIDWLLTVPREMQERLHQEIFEYEEEKTMLLSFMEMYAIEKGLKKGLEQGREEALVELVSRQLVRRCGSLSGRLQTQIKRLSVSQLEELGEALLDFGQVKDLREWLKQHPPVNAGKSVTRSRAAKLKVAA